MGAYVKEIIEAYYNSKTISIDGAQLCMFKSNIKRLVTVQREELRLSFYDPLPAKTLKFKLVPRIHWDERC